MTIYIRFFLILLCFSCASCQQKQSLESVRSQFQQSELQLLKEFEAISSPSDFERHETKTSEIFEDIAEAMVLVNTFSSEELEKANTNDRLPSDRLENELKRILNMPGGEEWLIRCQTKATRLLDIQSHKSKNSPKK